MLLSVSAILQVWPLLVFDGIQLYRFNVQDVGVILANVGSQVVLSIIPRTADRTWPYSSFGVLGINVSLQPLFVVEGFVTMLALVIPQVLVSISNVSIQHLH